MTAKHFIPLYLLLLMLIAGCGASQRPDGPPLVATAHVEPFVEEGEVRVGEPAPDFVLPTSDGGVLDTSELRGKAIIVNFWATWCGPCRVEMPELQAAYEARRDDLEVIGVEIRASGAPEESATFLNEVGVSFPTARDAEGIVEATYIRRPAWPTTVFIDQEGIVRFVQIGPMDREFIEEQLDGLGL